MARRAVLGRAGDPLGCDSGPEPGAGVTQAMLGVAVTAGPAEGACGVPAASPHLGEDEAAAERRRKRPVLGQHPGAGPGQSGSASALRICLFAGVNRQP